MHYKERAMLKRSSPCAEISEVGRCHADEDSSETIFSGRNSPDELSLRDAEDTFFADFDLCPSLEDLLNDPLLEEDCPFAHMPPSPSACPPPSCLQAETESSSHSVPEGGVAKENANFSHVDGVRSESSAVGRGSSADTPGSEDAVEKEKRIVRMLRNRESALLSRQRKKLQASEKDKQINELQARISQISGLSNQLASENILLRQHIFSLCQQSGQPIPSNLLSFPPLLSPQGELTTASHTQKQTSIPAAQQKVPIQRMPAARPAPSVKATKSSSRAPKRRKQQMVAGGTTVMAALFCFFVFWSPMSPSLTPQRGANSIPDGPPTSLPAVQNSLQNQGRVLQMTGEAPDTKDRELQWLIQPSSNWTIDRSLLPSDLDTESRALQHLKEIGPVAVFSKYDTQADQFRPPAPWKSLASLADAALARDGISKSAKCEKVFSVDVSAVDDPDAVQRQLQQYMAQTNSFKGRYQALALPPVGQKLPALEFEAHGSGIKHKSKVECSKDTEDDYIISVMMPTRDQLDGYTSLSKLYVVVLNPNRRYATYSCDLERPILI